MLNRRTFMAAIAALPLVGGLVPESRKIVIQPITNWKIQSDPEWVVCYPLKSVFADNPSDLARDYLHELMKGSKDESQVRNDFVKMGIRDGKDSWELRKTNARICCGETGRLR